MKTAIISVLAIIFSAQTFASKNPDVNRAIEKAVQHDQRKLNLEKDHSEFVKMSLSVDKKQGIQILAVNASNDEVKSYIVEKVSELSLDNLDIIDDTLYYNFVFKKL